jgi:general secretion pathway protein G
MVTRRAFTLVEIVVVVLILGIIATVAVPRVMRRTVSDGETALKQDLSTVRSAIERYASDHRGTFPGAVADGDGHKAGSEQAVKNQLMHYTNEFGAISKEKNPAYPFGPYLRGEFPRAPVGPRIDSDTLKVENAGHLLSGKDGSTAWRYDIATGELILNSTAMSSDGTTSYDAF